MTYRDISCPCSRHGLRGIATNLRHDLRHGPDAVLRDYDDVLSRLSCEPRRQGGRPVLADEKLVRETIDKVAGLSRWRGTGVKWQHGRREVIVAG